MPHLSRVGRGVRLLARAPRRWYEYQPFSVGARWLKRLPLERKPTCIFVTLMRDGAIAAQALAHMNAWSQAGWQLVVVVVRDDIADDTAAASLAFARCVLNRQNRGYDFAAWADALRRLSPEIARLPWLATVNDSVFGPLDGFTTMLDRVAASDADFIGATDSYEIRHHYQSYLLFFNSRAVRHSAFRRFWRGVRIADRTFVIENYETRLLGYMRAAGLRCAALFPAASQLPINPTLSRWRELIGEGFPYVKADLLRSNPWKADLTDWDGVMASRGYDIGLVTSALKPNASALQMTVQR